jgi:hypothetical protein
VLTLSGVGLVCLDYFMDLASKVSRNGACWLLTPVKQAACIVSCELVEFLLCLLRAQLSAIDTVLCVKDFSLGLLEFLATLLPPASHPQLRKRW